MCPKDAVNDIDITGHKIAKSSQTNRPMLIEHMLTISHHPVVFVSILPWYYMPTDGGFSSKVLYSAEHSDFADCHSKHKSEHDRVIPWMDSVAWPCSRSVLERT